MSLDRDNDRYILVKIINKGTAEGVLSWKMSSHQRGLASQVPLYMHFYFYVIVEDALIKSYTAVRMSNI